MLLAEDAALVAVVQVVALEGREEVERVVVRLGGQSGKFLNLT
jgi:hypothetical protein